MAYFSISPLEMKPLKIQCPSCPLPMPKKFSTGMPVTARAKKFCPLPITSATVKQRVLAYSHAKASVCTVVLLCITVYHIKYITRQARVRFQAPDDFFFHLFFNFCTFITHKPNLNKPNFNLNLT